VSFTTKGKTGRIANTSPLTFPELGFLQGQMIIDFARDIYRTSFFRSPQEELSPEQKARCMVTFGSTVAYARKKALKNPDFRKASGSFSQEYVQLIEIADSSTRQVRRAKDAIEKAVHQALQDSLHLRSGKPEGNDFVSDVTRLSVFFAVVKALGGLDYQNKADYKAHAEEAWSLIEKGYGFLGYHNGMPYLYAAKKPAWMKFLRL
jgi:hypothetical protein